MKTLAYDLHLLYGMKTIIKIECCVCHKDMGTKDGKGVSGVSHAYCPKCLEDVLKGIRK